MHWTYVRMLFLVTSPLSFLFSEAGVRCSIYHRK